MVTEVGECSLLAPDFGMAYKEVNTIGKRNNLFFKKTWMQRLLIKAIHVLIALIIIISSPSIPDGNIL